DTGLAETFQLRAIDGLGIGLERDFRRGREIHPFAHRLDDGRDLARIEERRRPSAEEDRVSLEGLSHSVGHLFRRADRVFRRADPRDLAPQRVDVARLQRLVIEAAVEVAVVADRRAERDVDVDAEHWAWPRGPIRWSSPFRRTSPARGAASTARGSDPS